MQSPTPSGTALARRTAALVSLVALAAATVDALYEAGRQDAAENLDALLADVEELLEDTGDFEEGGDLENDELSEVDEDGAHERATALPEDEVRDDDLDFASGLGRYAVEPRAAFHDATDEDLDFSYTLDHIP